MTIAQLMIPELKAEAAMTRRLLARIPNDKLSFTPGHGIKTIGWNASHLVEIVGWVEGIVNGPGLDLATFEGTPPVDPAGVSALLKTFDANLAQSLKSLEGVSDAKMAEPWTMRNGETVYFTIEKGECLRKWVFTHTAHHRGILSVLLRLAGVEHGSIYEE
jgi:uncharacterized damage-inducible protein DinB